jgi:hypothetical protein
MAKQARLFKLSNEDKARLGDELAGVVIEIRNVEAEKSDVAKEFRDKIEGLYERAGKLAATLQGSELECATGSKGDGAEATA